MMISTEISTQEFDLIRKYVEKETSISLAEDKVYLVETRLREIMLEEGISNFTELHQKLISFCDQGLKGKVLDAMTTNETLWFRDSQPFDVFTDFLLPSYAREIKEGKRQKIRVWSAACSSGQEPYSMVMAFMEAAKLNSTLRLDQLEILATDFSDKALAKAKEGVYGSMAMSRGLPSGYREKYFSPAGDKFEVNQQLKDRILFRKFNLQDSFITMGSFDVILTRYVLIYFNNEFKRQVLQKAHGALEPGGVLFVGSSESLPEGTPGYSLIRAGRSTYYQKVEEQPRMNFPASKPAISSAPKAKPKPLTSPKLKPSQEGKSNTQGLEKATEDLADLVKKLQEINSKNS